MTRATQAIRAVEAANTIAQAYRNYRNMGASSQRAAGSAVQFGAGTLRRGYPKRKKYPKKMPMYRGTSKPLRQQIKEIKKELKSDQATHMRRERVVGRAATAVNQVSNDNVVGSSTSQLETAMANLRYYDPATPGTLVTANASTGTYTRQIHFMELYTSLQVRNNYQVPCVVKLYCFVPKYDTSTTPGTFFSDGITDQVISGASTSPMLFPTDINSVNDNYTAHKVVSKYLEPGKSAYISYKHKAFDYDPANVDTHGLTYQRKYGSHLYYIRVVGVHGHDTAVTTEFAPTTAGVDYVLDRKMVISYDAGVNLNDISYSDASSSSFTNGGVVSNRPVSDNQSYSQG